MKKQYGVSLYDWLSTWMLSYILSLRSAISLEEKVAGMWRIFPLRQLGAQRNEAFVCSAVCMEDEKWGRESLMCRRKLCILLITASPTKQPFMMKVTESQHKANSKTVTFDHPLPCKWVAVMTISSWLLFAHIYRKDGWSNPIWGNVVERSTCFLEVDFNRSKIRSLSKRNERAAKASRPLFTSYHITTSGQIS